MPNLMVTLPNIGGALCSTPQSLADTHYLLYMSSTYLIVRVINFHTIIIIIITRCRAVTLPRRKTRWNL